MNYKWTEPAWKSYLIFTKAPIFTPEQCDHIIKMGQSLKVAEANLNSGLAPEKTQKKSVRTSNVSWIPFNLPEAQSMYSNILYWARRVNVNNFGFDGLEISELAQYTEYPEGGFYDWHTDSKIEMSSEPPVRKLSMTCLLNDPSEFEGGEFEYGIEGNLLTLNRGHAVFFASFINHRVRTITKGNRKSLVVWFSGPPFK